MTNMTTMISNMITKNHGDHLADHIYDNCHLAVWCWSSPWSPRSQRWPRPIWSLWAILSPRSSRLSALITTITCLTIFMIIASLRPCPCHERVHFLPKKHCFWPPPKAITFLDTLLSFEDVNELRKLSNNATTRFQFWSWFYCEKSESISGSLHIYSSWEISREYRKSQIIIKNTDQTYLALFRFNVQSHLYWKPCVAAPKFTSKSAS